jgi:hypothetical protein
MKKTSSAHKKWLETHETWVHFVHRDSMRRKEKYPEAKLPSTAQTTVPKTTLPVDCTGNATVSCPMDGNDTLGDCGPVMCAHTNTIRTYGQGKTGFTPVLVPVPALEAQYETVSGGDTGTTEDMLVGNGGGPNGAPGPGIWLVGIAGDKTQTVVDHLDFDVTNVALTQYLIDQFYAVCMEWSVPDDFMAKFTTGVMFSAADTPNPDNGHFTPLSDVDVNGNYRIWTWGTWCWGSPAFIGSVDPSCFVTFSALQFNKEGFDSHGRHVSDQAAAWVAVGGNAQKVQTVVGMFPTKTGGPPPAPVSAPVAKSVSIWTKIAQFFEGLF